MQITRLQMNQKVSGIGSMDYFYTADDKRPHSLTYKGPVESLREARDFVGKHNDFPDENWLTAHSLTAIYR